MLDISANMKFVSVEYCIVTAFLHLFDQIGPDTALINFCSF